MLSSIDLFCFFDWSVIQPENYVSVIIKLWARDRDGFIGIVGKNGE